MAAKKIRVEGADRLVRTLKAAGASLDDLKALHRAVGELVAPAAQRRAPTGETRRLRDSIRTTGTGNAAYIRAGRASIPYAGVQEFGWAARRIQPQPYMYPAVDEQSDRILDEYWKATDRVLGTVKGD